MGILVTPETCERIRRLVPVHGICATSEITGVNRTTIWRIKKRRFRAWSHDSEKRLRPSDFAIQSRHMSHEELRRHYKAGSVAVTRWRRELAR